MKNITTNFQGITDESVKDRVTELFLNLENKCPNLYKIVDKLVQEVTDTGPFTLKFLSEAHTHGCSTQSKGIWGAKNRELTLIANSDMSDNYNINLIFTMIFELHNALNKEFNDILNNPLQYTNANEYAKAAEKAEFEGTFMKTCRIEYSYINDPANESEQHILVNNNHRVWNDIYDIIDFDISITLEEHLATYKPGHYHYDFYVNQWQKSKSIQDIKNMLSNYKNNSAEPSEAAVQKKEYSQEQVKQFNEKFSVYDISTGNKIAETPTLGEAAENY